LERGERGSEGREDAIGRGMEISEKASPEMNFLLTSMERAV
jgi:hypothetical protein